MCIYKLYYTFYFTCLFIINDNVEGLIRPDIALGGIGVIDMTSSV